MTQHLPITNLVIGQTPEAVLVCGDPDRAAKTAGYLQNSELVTKKREYHAYTGLYQETPIMVCSHGVGAAGAAIAFEELIASGAKKLIRIGTCGGIQPFVKDGDLVIATSAIAQIGYIQEGYPPHFPAAADPFLTVDLVNASREISYSQSVFTGMVITRDMFYAGVETPQTPNYQTLADANVMAVEMECAALFAIGAIRGVQTAAILAVDGNVLSVPESMDDYKPDRQIVADAISAEIEIALNALISVA